ncbi:MAG: hypothetical protein ACRC4G_06285 [Alphaproteobacteria bacterium]
MNLDILKNGNSEWMFKGERTSYDPNYRHVICRGIGCLINQGKEKEEIKNKIEKMKNFKEEAIIDRDFFDMYAVDEVHKPVFIVDQTNGCFPLVCYREKGEHASKYSGFRSALKDIDENFEKFCSIIESSKEKSWDKELQSKLEKAYNYKN